MNVSRFTVFLLSVCAIPCQAQMRTWTDRTSQREVQAEFIELKDGVVVVRRADDTVGQVTLERLSKADQDYVTSQNTPAEDSPSGSQQRAAADPEPELPETPDDRDITRQGAPRPSTGNKSMPMDPKIAVIRVLCALTLAVIVALACRRRAFVYRVPADVFLGCLVGMLLAAGIELHDKTTDFFPASWKFLTSASTWDVRGVYRAVENVNWQSTEILA